MLMKVDPVENTEEYRAILPELEKKIEAELKNSSVGKRSGRLRWQIKAKILKRDYGIEWKSPAVLNPHIKFD
jgi:polyisoprenoid-binding protein YceI